MKIAFWSPLHGTGATSDLLALSIVFSEIFGKKTLVTQTHFSMNNLEKPLLGNVASGQYFADTGLDAVIRHFKSGDVSREQVENCSIRVSENLFLLAGTRTSSKESYENRTVQSMITHIISIIEKFYAIVLVDTNSGINEQSMEVIKECDFVVVALRQNRTMIEEFINSRLFPENKVFFLIGNYDSQSRYNINNLRRIYKEISKKNSAVIPYNTQYMDAVSEDRVMRYVRENLDADETYSDYEFFSSIKEAAVRLLEFTEM